MNSKKEVIAAALLAIALAAGLGTLSYGLFTENPPPTKLESILDVYTQKGGIGANVSDGVYEPFDNVSIYAYLTQGGGPVRNTLVTFTVKRPDNTGTARTTLTNDSGIAETSLLLLPSQGQVTGTWQILANATINDETETDTVSLQCRPENALIDVFSTKNGVASNSFLPNDTVLIEAQVSYKTAPIAGTPVTFQVEAPNNQDFMLQTTPTDGQGSANVTVQIPWPSNFSLGTWQVTATTNVYGQTINATTNFSCALLTPVIDAFTQKGGLGPNTPGGTFALDETVFLYVEMRDSLNQTISNELVGFEIKNPNSAINSTGNVYRTQITNASGLAGITFRIPPDPAYVGTYEVYVRAEYNGLVLLDTLTFQAEQQ